jgi:short subunit dehydrogenase-like uncharacterized protein
MTWLIYGANGYTGDLIAREAVARGQRPILAGRSREKIEALARELGCEARVFDVAQPQLEGVDLVLHCAGPFSRTSRPMVDACLRARVHYVDITGEIAVFEAIFARDAEAKQAGVTLLPGAGFDVVPTDCLAAMLHERMPDANELWLAFASIGGSLSPGTLKTSIEGAAWGSAIRRDGRITRVPHLWDVRTIPFPTRSMLAATIPWGDIATAYRTTRIPNIRVYSAQSPKAVRRMRLMRPLLPLLRFAPLRNLAMRRAGRQRGPSPAKRAAGRIELWGRVANTRGDEITMTMTVAEGYTFTVASALKAVERILAAPESGAFTPATLFGSRFVREIPGTTIEG